MPIDFPQEVLFPQKTIFKKGAALELSRECTEFGRSGLIVHGSSLERNGKLKDILSGFSAGMRVETFCRGTGEPDLEEVMQVIEKARSIKAEWLCGIGGGSVIDSAKAAAGLFNAKEKPAFYQQGGILKEKGIPFIASPTTAGTGSEATINSVIINREKKTKLSIRDRGFLAKTVVLDAELLKGTPRSVMAYAAMDALVQAYESYTSKNATWFSEVFALKSIDLINKNIIPAYESADEENLSSLLLASYLCGIALSASRLGVIHGLAHPLGALYNLPHGLVCAALFIPSIKINRAAIGKKYDRISDIMGEDFMKRAESLLRLFGITSPFRGRPLIEKETIIKDTLTSGSTAANPRRITAEDVEFMLSEIF